MGRRRFDPQLVKKNLSYSIEELAAVLAVHRNTITHWMRSGLLPIDEGRPVLFRGEAVRRFLLRRREAKARCGKGEFYCMHCKAVRQPAGVVVSGRSKTGHLIRSATCAACGHKVSRLGLARDVNVGVEHQSEHRSITGARHSGSEKLHCRTSPVNHNAKNERIKRDYVDFLTNARRQGVNSVDGALMALRRFEEFTQLKDFGLFRRDDAKAFKSHLLSSKSQRGSAITKATVVTVLGHIRRFFLWLSEQPQWKPRFQRTDADYFNPTLAQSRIAARRRHRFVPSVEQVRSVITCMPAASEIHLRNRAVVACILLTAARVASVASLRLKHVDVMRRTVWFDANEVRTKHAKSFVASWFPVGEDVETILRDWIRYLTDAKGFTGDDPLFPRVDVGLAGNNRLGPRGLKREAWRTTGAIREIFRQAALAAGVPCFSPHIVRHTLAQLGERLCRNAEEMKAWSQNMGHDHVATTLCAYGAVDPRRQIAIIDGMCRASLEESGTLEEIMRMLGDLRQRGTP